MLRVTLESGYPLNAKHAELERSVYQLQLKAVEMLRSSTRLRVMEMTSVWNIYGKGISMVLWKTV